MTPTPDHENIKCPLHDLSFDAITNGQSRIESKVNLIDVRVQKLAEDIAALKVKSGVWGFVAGAIPSAVAIIYMLVK
jgi:hypothetical protein